MRKKRAISAFFGIAASLSSHAVLASKPLTFEHLWTSSSTGAEIGAYDNVNHRVYTTNPKDYALNVIDARDGQALPSIELNGQPNSVAFCGQQCNGAFIAVAVENEDKQAPGCVVFFNATTGEKLGEITVGSLPDMLTFTPDGKKVIVANEGEPNDDYTVDPEGSISIIDISHYASEGPASVETVTLGFAQFNNKQLDLIRSGVRIFGPSATVGQDIEPEYITVAKDSKTAWVSLQENNALAVIDLEEQTILAIHALGSKNHLRKRNTIDASNKDGIDGNRARWPVRGLYMPDAIASYQYAGTEFVITTNEGDARDYDGYSEETRVKDLTLDPWRFPDALELQKDENLGRLKTTTSQGDIDADGDVDEIYAYGARSFSIWGPHGTLVWDSGNQLSKIVLRDFPNAFDDKRSDDKGGEPEAVVIGNLDQRSIAFIGLERYSVVLAYDVSNPYCPRYVGGVHTESDISPEGLMFVSAQQSFNGKNLLGIVNEVSKTTSFHQIDINHKKLNRPSRCSNR